MSEIIHVSVDELTQKQVAQIKSNLNDVLDDEQQAVVTDATASVTEVPALDDCVDELADRVAERLAENADE